MLFDACRGAERRTTSFRTFLWCNGTSRPERGKFLFFSTDVHAHAGFLVSCIHDGFRWFLRLSFDGLLGCEFKLGSIDK